jgi:hypothetical protein
VIDAVENLEEGKLMTGKQAPRGLNQSFLLGKVYEICDVEESFELMEGMGSDQMEHGSQASRQERHRHPHNELFHHALEHQNPDSPLEG